MKKILSIAGIVCFSMLVAVGTNGIYSWFTDQSQRVNSFSVGMNEVEIREEFPDQELTPGKIIKKEAGFTNTGMVPMYVRAVYLFSNKEAEEGSELLMGSTLWEKADDGYYYYKKIVQPQESTELFLKGIHWKKQKITENGITIFTLPKPRQKILNASNGSWKNARKSGLTKLHLYFAITRNAK